MAHAPHLLALMARPCINHAWIDGKFVDSHGRPICRECAQKD